MKPKAHFGPLARTDISVKTKYGTMWSIGMEWSTRLKYQKGFLVYRTDIEAGSANLILDGA